MRVTRRNFLATGALAGAAMASSRGAAGVPAPSPRVPADGGAYRPVVTPNGWTLPWRRDGVWKEFDLVAEPVTRELAPGLVAHLWGYNGQSPGPTIECVEGDRVRILVGNRLREPTTIHWPGLPVPHGMSGARIAPGQTFVFEVEMKKSGTFLYRPHWDAAAQAALGLAGAIVVHPRAAALHRVDRDFVVLANSFAVDAPSQGPRVPSPLWTLNGRVFPGIDSLAVRTGERVRLRVANVAATGLTLQMLGHAFSMTGTGGGWVPESARWPETAIDVPAGGLRAIEFTAEHEGDWALQCIAPPAEGGATWGMNTLIKVRAGLATGEERDPGAYAPPPGTSARELKSAAPRAPRARPQLSRGRHVEVKVAKPNRQA